MKNPNSIVDWLELFDGGNTSDLRVESLMKDLLCQYRVIER